jgi:hypothetical protein
VLRECPHEIHQSTSAREATSISSGGRPRIGRLLQSPTASAGTFAVVPCSKCRYMCNPS